LPLGKTLLLEENGTTDFAGALLRYYAAEGVVQDQKVHVIGMPEQWGRTLPGLIGTAEAADEKSDKRKGERMKIAWRYERLGEFGTGVAGARGMLSATIRRGKHANMFIICSNRRGPKSIVCGR
jgi:elongator complex protein 4